MTKKIIIGLFALLLAAIGLAKTIGPGMVERGQNKIAAHDPFPISQDAQTLHDSLFIGDLHTDSLLWGRDILARSDRGHVDVSRLQDGNAALIVFPAVTFVPSGINYEENEATGDIIKWLMMMQWRPIDTWTGIFARGMHHADTFKKFANRAPDELMLVQSRADLETLIERRASGDKIVGGILAFEGAQVFEGDVGNIDTLFAAGHRIMELVHFFDNELGGSLHGTSGEGLTEFGRAAVARIDELGAIIDVAHSSEAMVRDVLDMNMGPLVVSHTGMKGACDTPRNIPDDLMKRIADGGGLIGIGFWDAAVCDITPAGIVRSLRYAIDLLGVDHVALGSDWDGGTTVQVDASELPALTQAMMDAGFSEHEIRAVMGANMQRFLLENLP